jgi:hypothetical protein
MPSPSKPERPDPGPDTVIAVTAVVESLTMPTRVSSSPSKGPTEESPSTLVLSSGLLG